MTTKNDPISRELEWFDPVVPGELEESLEAPAAAELRDWIVSLEVEPAARRAPAGGPPGAPRNGRVRFAIPGFALAALAFAALAALMVLPRGESGGGDEGAEARALGGALDRAAAAAIAPRAELAAAHRFTYRKTREFSLSTSRARGRAWSVSQRTTREEWIAWDGSGLLRVAAGPTRFIAPADRAEWAAAGRPRFLALGFAGHTEDHWLATGMLDRRFEQLPTEPAALADLLRHEAETHRGGLSVTAATLQEIAEGLLEPGASPELRRALFEAVSLVPGAKYLGAMNDREGRSGVAVGADTTYAGRPALYELIFDPATSAVLATETRGRAAPGTAPKAAGLLLRARVYLESKGIESTSGAGNLSLAKFEMDSRRQPTTPYLVYRISAPNPWSRAIDASFDDRPSGGLTR